MLALRDAVFQLLERKSPLVYSVQQPDEENDLWFICAFDGRDLRAKGVNSLGLIVPLAWLHGHQNDFKLTFCPVGSGAGDGDGAPCGFGKHPSGAVIAGVAGSGGVAVKPTSSG